jgi:hypothetical protein
MNQARVGDRRSILKAAGAGLVAAAVPSLAAGALPGERALGEEEMPSHPRPVYLHGCGWNRDLSGIFGELCLVFEMRAELNGTGVGTFRDDVHPEVSSQFQIHSARKQGHEYIFEGKVISSRDPSLVGLDVEIAARKTGSGTGKATITVGSKEQDLVVIAIIAVLIGLLVPSIQ